MNEETPSGILIAAYLFVISSAVLLAVILERMQP